MNKDVPMLKRDVWYRFAFSILFLLIFICQLIVCLVSFARETLTLPKMVSVGFVLLTAIFYSGINLIYAYKSFKRITIVNKKGNCVSRINILYNLEKHSFIKLYNAICAVISIIASIVLLCVVIYSLLNIVYFNSISFYLPLLFVICLTCYSSSYHIMNEIKVVETVYNYNGFDLK